MSGQIEHRNMPLRPQPQMPSRAAQGPSQGSSMTPKEIIGIIRRHVLLIIIFTAIGLSLGVAGFILMKRFNPQYSATAMIEVLSPAENDPTVFGSVLPPKEIYYNFKRTKAAYLKQQSMLQSLLQREDIRKTNWFKKFQKKDGLDIGAAVKALKKKLSANASRDTDFITVTMGCKSKKESALIVNEMVELFVTQQRIAATSDISKNLSTRTVRREAAKKDLDAAENALTALRSGAGAAAGLSSGQNFSDYINKTLEQVENTKNKLESEAASLETQIATLQKRAEGDFDDIVKSQIDNDPTAIRMRQTIDSLEVALARLENKYGENHPQLMQTRNMLQQQRSNYEQWKIKVGEQVRNAGLQFAMDRLAEQNAQREELQQQLNESQGRYRELVDLRAQYETKEATRDSARNILEGHEDFINKLETSLKDPGISKVKIGSLAPEPLYMSSPKNYVYIMGGFALGFIAGVGLAFAIEMLNDLVRTPSDVMKHLHSPLLGMICHSDEDDEVRKMDMFHVVSQAPYSVMSECYRQLKTNIKLSGSGGTHKTLLITSPSAGCGKTSVACNLTSTFVAEHRKVLFIDANFRRPSSLVMFPYDADDLEISEHTDAGLSNFLMSQCDIDDVIRKSKVQGLDVIDTGPLPENPAALLAGEKMNQLLENVKQAYDYVIIDSPPLIVSDAKVLAAKADGTVVVFNASSTRRGQAQRTLRELKDINANVVGSVLLGVRSLKGGYFQESYQLYQDYTQAPLVSKV